MATAPSYLYGDTCNAVLNTARSRVDDLILTPANSPTSTTDPGLQLTQVGGATLLAETDSAGNPVPRTQIYFNSGWRKFQKYLSNLGYRFMIDTKILAGIGSVTWISWNTTPALPADLIAPLKVRERTSGSGTFSPMVNCLDGLLNVAPSTLNRMWEWRNGAIQLPGASGSTDLQIRYIKYYPDFVANSPATNTPWYYQLVPIPQALSPLAWYVAYEVLVPRIGEAAAAPCLQNAQAEADLMFNDQARADRRSQQVNESWPRPGTPPQVAPQGAQQ